MGQAIAYGSISIIDMTDLGEFSIQPTSNRPLSVIYDPDAGTYNPNWGSQNLIITPICYYGGTEISVSDSHLTTTWTRQVNGGTIDPLDTGESNMEGSTAVNVLTVSANKFNGNVSLITYRVTGQYTEPDTGQVLRAQGQITFSLVKNATITKNCKIIGDSIIKLKTNGDPYLGYNSVVLHVDFTGVSVGQNDGWMYQKDDGTWGLYPGSSYPGTNNDGNVTITYNDTDSNNSNKPVFTNDKCVIKFVTSNPNVYDIHTVTILRDGPAGDKVVSAVLTNEDQMIPVTTSGTSQLADYTDAETQIMIYEGGVNVTESWTINSSVDQNSGVTIQRSTSTGAHASQNDKVRVTNMENDSGIVTFTCTKNGSDPLTKVFSLVKVRAGVDGISPTIYSLEPDSYAINKAYGYSVYTPDSVVFRAYSKTGGSAKQPYSGRYEIYANTTYDAYKTAIIQGNPLTPTIQHEEQDASTFTVQMSALVAAMPEVGGVKTLVESFLVILYSGGGFSEVLDAQSVVVTNDGPPGPEGQGAINITFGNSSDILNCDNSNKLLANTTIEIPFKGFKGTQRVACNGPTNTTIKFTALKRSGVVYSVTPNVTNSTTSAEGIISWTLLAGDEITQPNGKIDIIFTIEGQQVTQSYSWSRNTASKNGQNAVIFQLFTTGSDYITQSIRSVQLQTSLMDGSTEKGGLAVVAQRWNSAKWSWYKWQKDTNDNDTWKYMLVSTNSNLEFPYKFTVSASDVDTYASYKCQVAYTPTGGSTEKTYAAYYSVFDKTDPIQVAVFSSFGEQIVNSQGRGVLYVRVTRLGEEIDTLYSDRFLTDQLTTGNNGDFYYLLDSTNKVATLKKYSNSAWANATETYDGTYRWTWRDKYGDPLPTETGYQYVGTGSNKVYLPKEGKVIYLDGSMIDTKIIADVEVTI